MNFSQIARTINPFSLKGRVAIVTGATNRIGRAAALALASRGASISLVYSSRYQCVEAERLASEINYFGSSASIPRAIRIRAHVTNPEDVFNRTEEIFKCRPHIVFHCAGILGHYYYDSFSSTPLVKFDSIMSANARNAFFMLQAAANRVAQDGGGRIFALSSWLVEKNRPGYGVYTASKAAVEAMVKSLANELQEKRIRITANCIAPWPMVEDAKTVPLRDIGPMVGFLCSDKGEWVNGQVVRVKGIYGRI